MKADEYDTLELALCRLKTRAEEFVKELIAMQNKLFFVAGLVSHNRDPGFPCITLRHVRNAPYFNTEVEALQWQGKQVKNT